MGSRPALLPSRPGDAEPQGLQANDQGSGLPRWRLQPQLSPGPTGEARESDSPCQPHGGAPGLCFRNNPKTKATSWLPQLSLQHARTEPPRAPGDPKLALGAIHPTPSQQWTTGPTWHSPELSGCEPSLRAPRRCPQRTRMDVGHHSSICQGQAHGMNTEGVTGLPQNGRPLLTQ